MYAQNIEWEEVKFLKGNKKTREKIVWLSKNTKTAPMPNRFNVSADLAAELGWDAGTRVNLYKAGSLFKLSKANTGLITLKKTGRVLSYNSWAMCAELHPDINGEEFDAWVDNGELYFKRKE